MQNSYQFTAKRVYPSERGLDLEFATHEEGKSRGITSNELDGLTIIKTF